MILIRNYTRPYKHYHTMVHPHILTSPDNDYLSSTFHELHWFVDVCFANLVLMTYIISRGKYRQRVALIWVDNWDNLWTEEKPRKLLYIFVPPHLLDFWRDNCKRSQEQGPSNRTSISLRFLESPLCVWLFWVYVWRYTNVAMTCPGMYLTCKRSWHVMTG